MAAGDKGVCAFPTNNLAVARAMPLVAPVMAATLFSNFFNMDKDILFPLSWGNDLE
jgi:hypothetical protein